MKKYHYDPEEYPNLKRLAGEMIPAWRQKRDGRTEKSKRLFPGGISLFWL